MEKGILIKDIKPNYEIAGIFIVVNPALLQSRSGVYWRLSLADATGSLEGKIWAPKSLEYDAMPNGEPAHVLARSVLYREQLQLYVDELHFLSEEEKKRIDQRDFLPASERDPDEMLQELKELAMAEFQHAPWRRLFLSVFSSSEMEHAFKRSPAARSIHHAWLGGLLEHTLGVAKTCLMLADLYPDIDRQTLLAGAIYHDLGKVREFSSEFAIEYTDEGSLHGHGYLGLEMLLPHLQKSRLENHLAEHLKHLILSHHGLPEFGAAKIPQTREAFLLHFADNIDARMTQCNSIFEEENVEPGNWSNWQKSLERKIFNPLPTPARTRSQNDKPDQEEICLSLLKE